MKRFYLSAAVLLLCAVVFFVGFTLGKKTISAPGTEGLTVREGTAGRLVNPLLVCETSSTNPSPNLSSLHDDLQKLIALKKTSGDADAIGVYVRELNTGKWTGVNETEQFNPASLLKVLVMITYVKAAEVNPGLLSEKIYYDVTLKNNDAEFFKPPIELKKGETYTIEQLIARMIQFSDNNAFQLLMNNLDPQIVASGIFSYLKLPPQTTNANGADYRQLADYVSPKEYSFFFRTLYNAAYLSSEVSEQALSLLTKTTFTDGIVAGVPAGTTVAHKFGEFGLLNANGTVAKRELHDCGIVYEPGKPYFICVMTKGKDFTTLASVIKDVANTVSRALQTWQ